MPIIWEIPVRLRADFLFYKATNLQGKRKSVRLFLKGRKGQIEPDDVRSMVVRAAHGTRVTLMTHVGPDWMDYPWRAVRLLEGFTVPGDKTPLPGVRVPDLDFLHPPSTRRASDDYQESYRIVERPEDGEGWTFGRVGMPLIKGRVRKILVEREER
ncbi:MAG: hypothetical protein ACI9MC_003262 [Kiritimatiellia bacterium]|jgi:hypothetical protein